MGIFESEKSREKQSYLKNLFALAIIDGKLEDAELGYLHLVGKRIGASNYEIEKIIKNPTEVGFIIPTTLEKKVQQIQDLVNMMMIDGEIDDKELQWCKLIALRMGLHKEIVDKIVVNNIIELTAISHAYSNTQESQPMEYTKIDLNGFKFFSLNHHRYQNGKYIPADNQGVGRLITINDNQQQPNTYLIAIYMTEGEHSLWRNNIVMAPKVMKVNSASNEKIELKGYGTDQMGHSFTDYGMTIFHENSIAYKIILHMFDRNIDIQYVE